MNALTKRISASCLLTALVVALALVCLAACSSPTTAQSPKNQDQGLDTSRFITAIDDDPDTVDFQCTSLYYTVAYNVFDRLVETETDANGNVRIVPSLAKSWEVSDDGLTYTFHLKDDVAFSNGSKLTSSDVLYSFSRLLTHPDSCNGNIVEGIVGAKELESGQVQQLKGFEVLSDTDFRITLEQPFTAFLSCLSMPGASIMDEETTRAAGDSFGTDPASVIGTGPFVLQEWNPGKGMLFTANANCFDGAPRCDGLDLRFIKDPEEARALYKDGKLDVLDLDDVPDYAEYYVHGDIYQDRLYKVQRVGLTYIALNSSMAPLDDVRVRQALQLSLDRQMLLDAVFGGRGYVENGIFPRGLVGYNPNLPEIPYDVDKARELMSEAGYPDGFDLAIGLRASSQKSDLTLVRLAASMWEEIGVRASIEVMSEDDFMRLRKNGLLQSYSATWIADYDDPDTFMYTFFGDRENTTFRSVCYQRDDVMDRVRAARTIIDPEARLREYQDLEQTIVQEDAAWIPLFSRQRIYVMSDRIQSVPALWSGAVKSRYSDMSITETP